MNKKILVIFIVISIVAFYSFYNLHSVYVDSEIPVFGEVPIIVETTEIFTEIQAKLTNTGLKITGHDDSLNFVFGNIDSFHIDDLKNLKFVKSIVYDYEVKALDDYASISEIAYYHTFLEGYTGTGIKIAIIDTGVEKKECLEDNIIDTKNYVAGESNIDYFGHGTHVAGIINGLAPDAQIIDIKVLGEDGAGKISTVIKGIDYAVSSGADIINLSLGAFSLLGDFDPLAMKANWAWDQGVIVVAAAGNSGPAYATINCPGVADKIITVGACDLDGNIADFSSRGPAFSSLKPDIVATGVNVISLRATHCKIGKEYDEYLVASGTSMATPVVTGACAILKSSHPDWSNNEMKYYLLKCADEKGTTYTYGHGVLDVKATNELDYCESGLNIVFILIIAFLFMIVAVLLRIGRGR